VRTPPRPTRARGQHHRRPQPRRVPSTLIHDAGIAASNPANDTNRPLRATRCTKTPPDTESIEVKRTITNFAGRPRRTHVTPARAAAAARWAANFAARACAAANAANRCASNWAGVGPSGTTGAGAGVGSGTTAITGERRNRGGGACAGVVCAARDAAADASCCCCCSCCCCAVSVGVAAWVVGGGTGSCPGCPGAAAATPRGTAIAVTATTAPVSSSSRRTAARFTDAPAATAGLVGLRRRLDEPLTVPGVRRACLLLPGRRMARRDRPERGGRWLHPRSGNRLEPGGGPDRRGRGDQVLRAHPHGLRRNRCGAAAAGSAPAVRTTWPFSTATCRVSHLWRRMVRSAWSLMIAMIHETNTYPGMKKNEDGRLRRCGSSLAVRLSCHHPASTAAKTQLPRSVSAP